MTAKTKKHRKQQIHKSTEEEETETYPVDFAFSITKVAVSQICRSVGFKVAQSSAVQILTLIATKYLQLLARTTVSYSNAANRTESNLFDITNALHDISFEQQGFVGASTLQHQSNSDSNNCLLNCSSILKEIAGFVKYSSEEIPFAKPIPHSRNDINVNKNSVWGSCDDDSDSRNLHIPKWLPAFPDERSYKGSNEIVVFKGNNNKLWENSDMVKGRSCNYGEEKVQNWGGDLSKDREKVRFTIGGKGKGGNPGAGIGVDIMRNGVCRGGKRVCWNVDDNDLIEQDKIKNGFQRRRC